jgi:hypothetical protein
MGAKFSAAFAAFAFTVLSFLLFASPASAAGSFKLKTAQVTESGGQWHLFVTLELPRALATAHVPMKFLFTKEMVFERALIDGHDQPVLNRTALTNQMPSVESVDVDFADGSGKVFKGTRFDFSLSRDHGYEAGQYRVKVRTSDGTDIGGPQLLTLNGDNPVVDRRSMTFGAAPSGVQKVATLGLDGGGAGTSDNDSPSTQSQEVAPSGSAAPFIPPDAYNKTPEEEVKTRPAGCCGVAGSHGDYGTGAMAAFAFGAAVMFARRRRRG